MQAYSDTGCSTLKTNALLYCRHGSTTAIDFSILIRSNILNFLTNEVYRYNNSDLHGIGYLHRDVKPGNYTIGRPELQELRKVYILDFGMCRKYTNDQVC
ncbi:hypothetical protein OSTOST_18138 [Ostertagia ostertagi]